MDLPPNFDDHVRLQRLREERHGAASRASRHARACGRTEMEQEARMRVQLLDYQIEMLKRKLGLPW